MKVYIQTWVFKSILHQDPLSHNSVEMAVQPGGGFFFFFFLSLPKKKDPGKHTALKRFFLGFNFSLGWDDRLGTVCRVDLIPLHPQWFHITKPTAVSDSFQAWTEIKERSFDLSAL